MRSDKGWAGGDYDRCKHGKENLDECPEDCYLNFIRAIQADALLEGKQVQRKCWQDFDKRDTAAEYHVMVAKAIEKRANEIKEEK